MLVAAALVGALFGVDSGRVMPLDPGTLRPLSRGAEVGRLTGPVAWSPTRRQVAVAVRPAGRVQIAGGRTIATGTRTAWLAWGSRRLYSVGGDGAIAVINPATGKVVARAAVDGRIEDVQAAGERLVVLLEGRLVVVSEDAGAKHPQRPGTLRIVTLRGVIHGGLAVTPDRAYVVDPGGVTEVDLGRGDITRHPLARGAKDSRPWRSATLLGDTLAVSGCDQMAADHRGCAKPYGLRFVNVRTWTSRMIDARAAAFRRTGDTLVLDASAYGEGRRLGLRAFTFDGVLRVDTLRGSDIVAQVGAGHAYVHIIGRVGSATRAIDLRTGTTRLLPARVPFLL